MSEITKSVMSAGPSATDDHVHRKYAVAAALEVIAARAPAMSTSGQLEHEMNKLSNYADLIQEALKVE